MSQLIGAPAPRLEPGVWDVWANFNGWLKLVLSLKSSGWAN
ncbi:MAG: hypothetical protein RMH97_02185 [Verrucomicrobiales bacterium]|nr:hypothetical protein [Verrucomicrobiales bacterium]